MSSVAFDPQSKFLVAAGGAMVRQKQKSITQRELIAWNIPTGEVRWQVFEEADRLGEVTFRPGGVELATACTGGTFIWSSAGKHLRTIKSEFLAGRITWSADGALLVAPTGNEVILRNADSGRKTYGIKFTTHPHTSAEAVAFVPGTPQLIIAASVIDNCGHTSGKLLRADYASGKVLKETRIDLDPGLLAIDPQGRWLCVAGERKARGCVLFWSLEKWKAIADQGAHESSVDGLAVSPDGEQLASTGADNVVRLWNTTAGKTVARLQEHRAEGNSRCGVAWSSDGRYIAFATAGSPPSGGVFLYELLGGKWQLAPASRGTPVVEDTALRHARVSGSSRDMDTFSHFALPTNRWPAKCPKCSLPDMESPPQPYQLSRGIEAAGDFSTAELGNFFVRERLRTILATLIPEQCRFYPTAAAKTGKATDWWLASPQTLVITAALPEKYEKCSACGEPKAVSHLDHLPFTTEADVFKSRQWTCSQIGEETKWYVDRYLDMPLAQVPKGRWTRLRLSRELWFSKRLLMLLRQLKIQGVDYLSALQKSQPTPGEAAWIAAQMERLAAAPPKSSKPTKKPDAGKWLDAWLKEHASRKPLTTEEAVRKWEEKHDLRLPADYVRFVTTVGRHTFADMLDREGYDAQIVGPRELDAEEYRRDLDPESDEQDPDGLAFALAINGDVLCFDLRAKGAQYPVHHFDHETGIFEPFADDFAAAVKRLAEKA